MISDGHHTFAELYDHRITLFMALCYLLHTYETDQHQIWRSMAHHDGVVWEGWFIMGIDTAAGQQISYHLPMNRWDEAGFATTLPCSPIWDGHQSKEVLARLRQLYER